MYQFATTDDVVPHGEVVALQHNAGGRIENSLLYSTGQELELEQFNVEGEVISGAGHPENGSLLM